MLKKITATILAAIMALGMSSGVFAAQAAPVTPQAASSEEITPRITGFFNDKLTTAWTFVATDNNLLTVTLNIYCEDNPGAFDVRIINGNGQVIATSYSIPPGGSGSLYIPAGVGQYTLQARACSATANPFYFFGFTDGWA